MTGDGSWISWRSCCLPITHIGMHTVKIELLNLGPHLRSDVEVDAGGALVCDVVVTEVKGFNLVETFQVACVSQFSDTRVSELVVTEIECFEIGKMLL